MEEIKARFLLNASDVFNFEQQNRILNHYQTASNFINCEEPQKFISPEHWMQFKKRCDRLLMEGAFERLSDSGVRFLCREDDLYPEAFKHLSCPPHLLYYKGTIPEHYSFGISMIGTRRPTLYGRQMSQYFASTLASEGMNIISGLAKGVDALCLKAALQAGGSAMAFLGTGIDRIYPKENSNLFKDMEKYGAILSEFLLGQLL